MYYEGRTHAAHRVSYAKHHGIPIGDVPPLLRHKCDVKLCCEPAHLEPGTVQDNSNDMVERGRSLRGSRHPSVKLTPAQVLSIRDRYKPRCPVNGARAMGREFNVDKSTISLILLARNWSWL